MVYNLYTALHYVAAIDFGPVNDLPESVQMGGTAIAIIDIIRMLPYVHCQQRFETFGDRITGIGFLRDNQLTVLVRGEPYPTGTKERHSFLLKLRLESLQGAESADYCVQ